MKPWTAFVAFLAALMLVCGLSAQGNRPNDDANTRSVQGVVTDSTGNPVADATVQLKDTKTLQIRSFRTGTDGSFHFSGLGTNTEYELKSEKDAATSGKKTLSIYDTQKTATVNLKLNK